MNRAYAMINPQEYFAESTEAFFSRKERDAINDS